MTEAETLSFVLSHACPTWVSDDEVEREFRITLHCTEVKVRAKLINAEAPCRKYEVLSCEIAED